MTIGTTGGKYRDITVGRGGAGRCTPGRACGLPDRRGGVLIGIPGSKYQGQFQGRDRGRHGSMARIGRVRMRLRDAISHRPCRGKRHHHPGCISWGGRRGRNTVWAVGGGFRLCVSGGAQQHQRNPANAHTDSPVGEAVTNQGGKSEVKAPLASKRSDKPSTGQVPSPDRATPADDGGAVRANGRLTHMMHGVVLSAVVANRCITCEKEHSSPSAPGFVTADTVRFLPDRCLECPVECPELNMPRKSLPRRAWCKPCTVFMPVMAVGCG